ncbi:predicted protein [Aspergillus nidulans FGSC A4]|nr:predicted protein [Aspergillus nidulans FGSC A4]|eukprot:XP_660184.1 predicted protein [Aspergillus nidulans FGSC A4]
MLRTYGRSLDILSSAMWRSDPAEPLLRDMLRFIADVIPRFYGPFASDMIRKAIIEFISAGLVLFNLYIKFFETEYAGRITLALMAPGFPYFLRRKTGMAESYAFFAFPESLFPKSMFIPVYLPVIPGLVRYNNFANDLLSYCKESILGGERFNYTVSYARTNDHTPMESLRETASSLNACVANTRATLADVGSKDLHGAVTKLFSGYAVYHYSAARYRLSELEIPELEAAKLKLLNSSDGLDFGQSLDLEISKIQTLDIRPAGSNRETPAVSYAM